MATLYERNKALKNRVSASDFSLSKEDIDKAWERGGQKQLDIVSDYQKKQEEENKKNLTTRFGGTKISAPQTSKIVPSLSTQTKSRTQQLVEESAERSRDSGRPIRDFIRNEFGTLGKFLFGESEEKFRGHTLNEPDPELGFVDSIKKDINTRGIIRQFVQASFKENKEKIQEGSFDLVKQGYTRNEAINLATKFYQEGKDSVPENVSITLRDNDLKTKAWASVEMLETFPAFKALTRTGGKVFFRETLTRAIATESAVGSRKILSEAFPKIQGTQELEDLISYTRTMADPQKSEQFLAEIMKVTTPTPVRSTEAQRVFYDNGIPIIRGTNAPIETIRGRRAIPNQTADALTLRKEINDVLAGQAEQSRLSNLDVFADEIKAGAIPFKSVPEEKVQMFISDAVKDVTRLKAGDRLATAKEVLESTLEKGAAKAIDVLPEDLVRLADGTFVYAPKNSLAKGVQGTLRSLRASQRAKVIKIERNRAISQFRKEVANEGDVFKTTLAKRELKRRESLERLSREVDEEAEFFNKELARREQAASAAKTLSEQGERTKKLIRETRTARDTNIAEIEAKAKETAKAVSEASTKVTDLTSEVSKIPKLIAKERDKARRAIEAVRKLRRLTPKERVKRINSIRKDRDANIARLIKGRKTLESQVVKARANLIKAKSKLVDKVATISKLRTESDAQLSTLRTDSKEIITKAKQVAKDNAKPIVQPAKVIRVQTPVQKARVKNTEEVSTLTNSIKESFSTTSKDIPEMVSSPINPVKGEGKTVESQIIKGLQDEVAAIRKNFEERGLSLADLPDTHKAIGNPELMKQAFADLVADPAKVYNDFMSGVLPEGTTRAAYALALMKSDFVLSNPSRMDMVARAFFKGNTRIAQELQSIKVFGRMDYLNIVGRFSNQADALLKDRGVDVEKQAKELLKRFDDEFNELKTVEKADVIKALDSITCPV